MGSTSWPPGPPGRLFRGHLPEFRRDRLRFLQDCARKYGDVVALRLGPRRVFVVSHPDAIEYVLASGARHFIKHFALRLNPLVLGNGLLTSEGDFWFRQRRLAQPAFQKQRLAGYGPLIVAYTERLLAAWEPGQTRDILTEMTRLTLEITAKVLFDADAGAEADEVRAALEVAQGCFLARFNSLMPLPVSVPTPRNLRMRQAVRRLDAILYRLIQQGRASGEAKANLLSLLLHARDEGGGSGMTDRQLRDEAMTLFLAGHETTALALAWTWYLLAQNPQAEARLTAELDSVLGGRPPTVADLPRLRYTEHVVLEALRLYPPAYTIGREARQACEVGGYRVPAGVTLLLSPWVVHRDPRWFADPETFEPDRWEPAAAGRLPRYAYFPFGGGPRVCIGSGFALLEATLVLATLAQKFRFTLLPGHPIVLWPMFTLRPKFGIRAVLTRR